MASGAYSSIFIEDPTFLLSLEESAKGAPFLKNVHRKFEKLGKWTYFAAIASVLSFLLLSYFFILPYLVDVAANNVPVDVENEWGDENFLAFERLYTIDTIGSKALTKFASDLKFKTDYNLRFYIIKSDIVNAFALPGGRVVVFTGIVNKMKNYDELVALLGHEVGHVIHRHSLRHIFHEYSYSYLLKLLVGNGTDILGTIGQSASQLSLLANSRTDENEADKYGLYVLQKNKVDPNGIVQLFSTLAKEEKSSSSEAIELISTHPNIDKRISKMKLDIKAGHYKYSKNPSMDSIFIEIKKQCAADSTSKED